MPTKKELMEDVFSLLSSSMDNYNYYEVRDIRKELKNDPEAKIKIS